MVKFLKRCVEAAKERSVLRYEFAHTVPKNSTRFGLTRSVEHVHRENGSLFIIVIEEAGKKSELFEKLVEIMDVPFREKFPENKDHIRELKVSK